MDELAVALRHRPGRAADPQRAGASTPRPACRSAAATSSRACARAPSASAGPTATRRRRPARGPLARRHRRRRLDLPGVPARRRRPIARARRRTARFVVAHQRHRHRHRRPDRARPRSPPTRSTSRSTRVRARDRRQRPAAGVLRRRLDGHRLVGLGGRRGLHARCASASTAERPVPADGLEVDAPTRPTTSRPQTSRYARHAFGAQFAEVRVDADTGEVRVPRLLGVFAAGRILNPHHRPLAAHRRHDHGPRRWRCTRRACSTASSATTSTTTSPQYHVAACTPTSRDIEATGSTRTTRTSTRWAPRASARSASSGTAAAIANAVHHATGVRVRDLPLRLDRLLEAGLSAAG